MTTITIETIEQDVIEETLEEKYNPLVNAIRGGKLVEVRWNELTEDEQRAAYCAMFEIYE